MIFILVELAFIIAVLQLFGKSNSIWPWESDVYVFRTLPSIPNTETILFEGIDSMLTCPDLILMLPFSYLNSGILEGTSSTNVYFWISARGMDMLWLFDVTDSCPKEQSMTGFSANAKPVVVPFFWTTNKYWLPAFNSEKHRSNRITNTARNLNLIIVCSFTVLL